MKHRCINTILYGPPGTGKTFKAMRDITRICNEGSLDELRRTGRFEFVTFHQSYGYEEFVEGIRPVINDEQAHASYTYHTGVFKRIAQAAALAALDREEQDFDTLWTRFLDHIDAHKDGFIHEEDSGTPYILRTTTNRGLIVREKERLDDGQESDSYYDAQKKIIEVFWQERDSFSRAYDSAKIYALIRERHKTGLAHAKTQWRVYLAFLDTVVTPREHTSLHHALAREEDAPEFDFTSAPQYVLVIDEINRGNISKVLGELITLLEPSKRIGERDEVLVRLPHSGELFGVPPNLHIIGTMNTADRSIAMMDTALRRRFEFIECMPDSSVLTQDNTPLCEHFAIGAMLDTLNARIEFLYDREHTIGHAFLIGVADFTGLRDVFLHKIVPLLQDYFYEDWEQVALVLNHQKKSTHNILSMHKLEAKGLFPGKELSHRYSGARVRHSLSTHFLNATESELELCFRQGTGAPEHTSGESPS